MGILNLVFADDKDYYDTVYKYYIHLPYIWVNVLVNSSKHPGFQFWNSMLKQDKKMEWQKFETFNAKYLALCLSLFKMADIEVILSEKVGLYSLSHQFPVTNANKDKEVECHSETFEGFYKLNVLKKENIENYKNCVFLNASGSALDAFGILNIKNHETNVSEIVFINLQTKITDPKAINPMVSEAMEEVKVKKWALLFLTNIETKKLSIKHKLNSALVSMKNFRAYYGYTYANRAQFFSGNEKIYINSTPIESLKIFDFTDSARDKIQNKRKK
ncbi:hypothetical protein RclHR1_08190008 [Rhizophagus clarus]|uniref:Uncharacterized protein n=1 Tax=Rhizophagus clarus TaxID=94130 RepID=A0A2Z6SFB4_9GLOM|nr:hypothetical protein RclHR1_08190008 [Rhizophagus clarus]